MSEEHQVLSAGLKGLAESLSNPRLARVLRKYLPDTSLRSDIPYGKRLLKSIERSPTSFGAVLETLVERLEGKE